MGDWGVIVVTPMNTNTDQGGPKILKGADHTLPWLGVDEQVSNNFAERGGRFGERHGCSDKERRLKM